MISDTPLKPKRRRPNYLYIEEWQSKAQKLERENQRLEIALLVVVVVAVGTIAGLVI